MNANHLFRGTLRAVLLSSAALLTWTSAQAQSNFNGWLCCNMRTDGSWISEINYESAQRIIPAGTPVEITGYGRYRVHTRMNGETMDLGNDYSREVDMGAFAHRYVVPYNPQRRLRNAPPAVQQAVRASRVRIGMTREQVIMSQGYPIANETPSLDSRVWKYWRSSGEEFHVVFNRRGVVEYVRADDPNLRARVTAR